MFLIAGCGLPSEQPTLYAPTVPTSYYAANTNVFTFNNTPQPSTVVLLGFELYYKLYDDSSGTALVSYQTDQSQISNTANAGISDLTSLGYQPLSALPSGYTQGATIPTRTLPLVPMGTASLATTSFPVTIPFNVAASGSGSPPSQDFFPGVFVDNATTPTVQIARYLPDPQNSGSFILKGFGSNGDIAITDGAQAGGDVPDSAIANTTGAGAQYYLLLAVYAIAFGELPDFTNTLYSTPTPLGTIELSGTFTQ